MKILAALEQGVATRPVLDLAALLERHLDVPVETIRIDGTGSLEDALVRFDEPDTLLTVIGARLDPTGAQPVGPVTADIIARTVRPVVVLPASAETSVPTELRRLLVPLDGTEDATRAAARAVNLFAGSGIDVVALHVFDAGTVPRFLDRAEHDLDPWAHEFLARYCAAPGASIDLRAGQVGDEVLSATEGGEIDLLALGWSRDLSAGRAAVVRGSLSHSRVPVLLIPIEGTPALASGTTAPWDRERGHRDRGPFGPVAGGSRVRTS